MAGPNSSPCGDKSLVDNTVVFCKKCKTQENGGWIRKRVHLANHGNLITGKTGR